jgi:hypothetical protein
MTFKCRYHKCGATKQNNPLDTEYCSGKCRKLDGAEAIAEPELTPEEKADQQRVASLKDYQKHPDAYVRRLEPEKLNWAVKLMNPEQLKQCGYRANRKPLDGDWDYEVKDESD